MWALVHRVIVNCCLPLEMVDRTAGWKVGHMGTDFLRVGRCRLFRGKTGRSHRWWSRPGCKRHYFGRWSKHRRRVKNWAGKGADLTTFDETPEFPWRWAFSRLSNDAGWLSGRIVFEFWRQVPLRLFCERDVSLKLSGKIAKLLERSTARCDDFFVIIIILFYFLDRRELKS